MKRKSIVLGLLVIVIVGLIYYTNIMYIKNENRKVQDKLQERIETLEEDREALEKRIMEIQETEKVQEYSGNLVLTDLQIRSNEIYKEGALKGKIYGNFDVVAKVKNLSNSEFSNVKVSSLFVRSVPQYEKDIKVESKVQVIDKLKPGEEKEVVFEGYHVDHPETIQEVIVNLLHQNINETDVLNVKKVNILAAFPPANKD